MASGDPPPPDPFATPILAMATAEDIEAHRKALEEEWEKELEKRKKFQLEQDSVRALSSYRQRRMRQRIDPSFPTTCLNFDDGTPRPAAPGGAVNNEAPEASRVGTGRAAADRATANRAAPPPPPPPPERRIIIQPAMEANGLPPLLESDG